MEITAYTLEHTAAVHEGAAGRGKVEAGKRDPLRLANGTAVAVALELPTSFYTESSANVFIWDGSPEYVSQFVVR